MERKLKVVSETHLVFKNWLRNNQDMMGWIGDDWYFLDSKHAPAQTITAPAQNITAPAQLITTPAQQPATGLSCIWPCSDYDCMVVKL